MRIAISGRESATYIKLRRMGYSISIIAQAFGRSTSAVHKRIRRAIQYGLIHYRDLRKIPNQTRRLGRARQHRDIMRTLSFWEQWILSDGDDPP